MFNNDQSIRAGDGYADELNSPAASFDRDMLGSDALLPTQLYGRRRGSAALEPMKRLMTAILVDAIGCYRRNLKAVTAGKRREFREAKSWLFEDRSDGPFSFDTVCYVLETDPHLLRRSLIQFEYTRVARVGGGGLIRRTAH
jgi:hypothetical protein